MLLRLLVAACAAGDSGVIVLSGRANSVSMGPLLSDMPSVISSIRFPRSSHSSNNAGLWNRSVIGGRKGRRLSACATRLPMLPTPKMCILRSIAGGGIGRRGPQNSSDSSSSPNSCLGHVKAIRVDVLKVLKATRPTERSPRVHDNGRRGILPRNRESGWVYLREDRLRPPP